MSKQPVQTVPDSEHKGIIGLLPSAARPYALLARFDRPIGSWLLYWPCAWGIALAGGVIERWDLLLWLLLGSMAMRGAGCVYNDIVDRDLDRQVERTRSRPLASGAISLKAAWIWLGILCLIGLTVWVQINGTAKLVALGSLARVAPYPSGTNPWVPPAWLGLVFTWGALVVGWPFSPISRASLLLTRIDFRASLSTNFAPQDKKINLWWE